jgi:predicted lipoprotein with Yx(FWY)xxD motif
MNLSGRGNTNLRGYGSGYGAGDGWSRGYNRSAPFYGPYGPYAYGRPPMTRAYPGYAPMPQAGGAGTEPLRYDGGPPGSGGSQRVDEPPAAVSGLGIVTDAAGMTLYTYAQDRVGESSCYGQCAANWPPAPVADDTQLTGGLTAVTRQDGSRQLALEGQPLYLWVGDDEPGDTSGDGLGGVWRVARR